MPLLKEFEAENLSMSCDVVLSIRVEGVVKLSQPPFERQKHWHI